LVCADTIAQVNEECGWSLKAEETRRNIVSGGVDLNQWETERFRMGEVVLEGVEPCATLGKTLGVPADVDEQGRVTGTENEIIERQIGERL